MAKVGDKAACADCGRPGTVASDGPTPPIKVEGTALEVSAYGAHEPTCHDCEELRFRCALPERGRCLNCGAPVKDGVMSRSFCHDGCAVEFDARTRGAGGQAVPPTPGSG